MAGHALLFLFWPHRAGHHHPSCRKFPPTCTLLFVLLHHKSNRWLHLFLTGPIFWPLIMFVASCRPIHWAADCLRPLWPRPSTGSPELVWVLGFDKQSLLPAGWILNSWGLSAAVSGTCPEDKEAISETRSNCFKAPSCSLKVLCTQKDDGGKEPGSVFQTLHRSYYFPLTSPARLTGASERGPYHTSPSSSRR